MSKESNARILDPQRFKIAKNMTVMPGGPENNNPMNVTDNASPPIQATSIYGDYAQNYAQMGTGMVNPSMVPHSKLTEGQTVGQRLNSMPYGMQQQPDTSGISMAPDGMESGRLAGEAQKYGLNPGPMGMTGMPAQPAPGAFPGAFPGSSGPPMMQGMQSAEQAAGGMRPQNSMNPMTPGSTPTKIKKKRA
tara:strand:+ start:177 stop:749 length:573 start_codon:yes stop_codon:yes gene_type:complete